MNLARPFVRRPVASSLIAVALVLLGGVTGAEGRRDAALGPLRRARGEHVLGDDEQVQRGIGGVAAISERRARRVTPCRAKRHQPFAKRRDNGATKSEGLASVAQNRDYVVHTLVRAEKNEPPTVSPTNHP